RLGLAHIPTLAIGLPQVRLDRFHRVAERGRFRCGQILKKCAVQEEYAGSARLRHNAGQEKTTLLPGVQEYFGFLFLSIPFGFGDAVIARSKNVKTRVVGENRLRRVWAKQLPGQAAQPAE